MDGAARSRTPGVVVSDWQSLRLDGSGLCGRVREQREASAESIDAAIAAGVDEFLTKPVDVQDLRLRLHTAERIVEFTAELRQLESFLPVCGYCKKVRDDKKYWQELET